MLEKALQVSKNILNSAKLDLPSSDFCVKGQEPHDKWTATITAVRCVDGSYTDWFRTL